MPAGARLCQLIRRAVDRRRELLSSPDTNVARVFHGERDGTAGLVIERYASALVVQLHVGKLAEDEGVVRAAVADCMELVGASVAYRKYFPRDRSSLSPALDAANRDPVPWIGAAPVDELEVLESGLTFLVRPHDGYATGLYLDHRERRKLVTAVAHGQRVLNAFAFTCAYGVAAARAGAAEVTNVDISKRCLEWGKRNISVNRFPLEQQRFICSDVLDYYRRAERQRRRFDLVILDPPTFSRAGRQGSVCSLPDSLEALARGACGVLEAGGTMLLTVNHHRTSMTILRHAVESAARSAGRRILECRDAPASSDFAGDPAYAKGIIVRLN